MGLEPKDLFVSRDSRKEKPHTKGKSTLGHPQKSMAKRYATAGAAVSALTTKHGKPGGQWVYHDASGLPVAMALRFNRNNGSKYFLPVSLRDDGGWYNRAPATPRPLYGLPDLDAASVVYVCEGEKAADSARSIGLVTTTSFGGSDAPELTDWTPLVGRTVVILPTMTKPVAIMRKRSQASFIASTHRPLSRSRNSPACPPRGMSSSGSKHAGTLPNLRHCDWSWSGLSKPAKPRCLPQKANNSVSGSAELQIENRSFADAGDGLVIQASVA